MQFDDLKGWGIETCGNLSGWGNVDEMMGDLI